MSEEEAPVEKAVEEGSPIGGTDLGDQVFAALGDPTTTAELRLEIAEHIGDALLALRIGERDYRAWRGEFSSSILSNDPKLAQWKVDAQICADPTYKMFHAEIAKRESRLEVLRAFAEILATTRY